MREVMKVWKALQGYKRHAGALLVVVPTALQLFGVPVDLDVLYRIEAIGAVIWGVGWSDAGRRWWAERVAGGAQ